MFFRISGESYLIFFLILGQSHPKIRLNRFFLNFVFIKFTEIVVDLERL